MKCTLKDESCYGRIKPSTEGRLLCYGHYGQTLWRNLPIKSVVRARDRFCRICGSADRLEIHHIFYPATWGAETAESLTLLCHDCHHIVATTEQRRKQYAARTIVIRDSVLPKTPIRTMAARAAQPTSALAIQSIVPLSQEKPQERKHVSAQNLSNQGHVADYSAQHPARRPSK